MTRHFLSYRLYISTYWQQRFCGGVRVFIGHSSRKDGLWRTEGHLLVTQPRNRSCNRATAHMNVRETQLWACVIITYQCDIVSRSISLKLLICTSPSSSCRFILSLSIPTFIPFLTPSFPFLWFSEWPSVKLRGWNWPYIKTEIYCHIVLSFYHHSVKKKSEFIAGLQCWNFMRSGMWLVL